MITDKLKELALAATPGPWTGFVDKGRLVAIMPLGRPGDICTFADPPSDADAAFMLAATPDAILALYAERDEAFRVIRETLWMAQRYATGRQSYAVGKYNDAARLAVKIGAVEAKRDGVLWALDGGNTAGLSGLTEAEFKAAIEYRDALSSAQEEVGRLRAVMRETSEYLRKLEGNMLENDADMMLDDCLPPSFHADQIDAALHIKEATP